MKVINHEVLNFLKTYNVCAAGIVTPETLEGGPPSADITGVLADAKSAISFAVPMDQNAIPPFFKKEDRRLHENDNYQANIAAGGIALWLAKWLEHKGHTSVPIVPNDDYLNNTPNGVLDMLPEISHRYLAVRSGVGHFGWSGNVITKEYGASIVLGCVITSADLTPTDPLPDEDNYCDKCGLCMSSCASGLMDKNKKTTVTLGKKEFTYSKRTNYWRCNYVCGGFNGLHPSGKWSTWSPGRFPMPDKNEDFAPAVMKNLKAYSSRPDMEGGYYHSLMPGKLYQSCGNCQLICHPDKEVRKHRYKMLVNSGVVVQHQDGSLEAMPPEKAASYIESLDPEKKVLYEDK